MRVDFDAVGEQVLLLVEKRRRSISETALRRVFRVVRQADAVVREEQMIAEVQLNVEAQQVNEFTA